jgi:hypothetical protein
MLFSYLSHSHAVLEGYVLQKLIKVQVDVGKRDWPVHYPDLFAKIHALISDPITCAVGFEFIKVFCEEVNSSKENLPFERKCALKAAFLTEVPSILQVCCSFLDVVYEKIAIYPATATPNPSPLSKSQTIKSPFTDKLLKHAFFNFDSNLHVSQSLPNGQQSPYTSAKSGSISPREERVSQSCLDIFISLLSWIPLSDFLNDSCIRCILKFAHLMSESGLSITALSCINEVYNRKYIPKEIGIFINLTFNSLLDIMKQLVAGDPKVSLARSDEK